MLSALRNFALTFAISALIFGILAYFIVGFVLDTMTSPEVPDDWTINNDPPIVTDSETSGTNTGNNTGDDPPDNGETIKGESFTMLIIGSDYQPELFDDYNYEEEWYKDPNNTGFPDKRDRPWGADAIILLRVDKEARKFVFSSIPRNTKIQLNGEDIQLGDTISEKGVEYLKGKVMSLTGLKIDYYVHIPVGAIAKIVDTVGTVPYYVPKHMTYVDPEQNLTIDLQQGTHNIDGNKAIQLLRYVGYANGNQGRMETAIEFMKAAFKKFTTPAYLTKVPEMYKTVSQYIETDFGIDDFTANLDLIFAYTDFENEIITYPGTYTSQDSTGYFEPKISEALDRFKAYGK